MQHNLFIFIDFCISIIRWPFIIELILQNTSGSITLTWSKLNFVIKFIILISHLTYLFDLLKFKFHIKKFDPETLWLIFLKFQHYNVFHKHLALFKKASVKLLIFWILTCTSYIAHTTQITLIYFIRWNFLKLFLLK